MKECGAKEIPEAAVTSLDLNGDGVNDYIINFEKYSRMYQAVRAAPQAAPTISGYPKRALRQKLQPENSRH